MFDSLDETMKRDLDREVSSRERWIRYAVVAVSSVLLFGGLYMGIRLVG
jgi:hypothetical protein